MATTKKNTKKEKTKYGKFWVRVSVILCVMLLLTYMPFTSGIREWLFRAVGSSGVPYSFVHFIIDNLLRWSPWIFTFAFFSTSFIRWYTGKRETHLKLKSSIDDGTFYGKASFGKTKSDKSKKWKQNANSLYIQKKEAVIYYAIVCGVVVLVFLIVVPIIVNVLNQNASNDSNGFSSGLVSFWKNQITGQMNGYYSKYSLHSIFVDFSKAFPFSDLCGCVIFFAVVIFVFKFVDFLFAVSFKRKIKSYISRAENSEPIEETLFNTQEPKTQAEEIVEIFDVSDNSILKRSHINRYKHFIEESKDECKNNYNIGTPAFLLEYSNKIDKDSDYCYIEDVAKRRLDGFNNDIVIKQISNNSEPKYGLKLAGGYEEFKNKEPKSIMFGYSKSDGEPTRFEYISNHKMMRITQVNLSSYRPESSEDSNDTQVRSKLSQRSIFQRATRR